MFAGIDQACFPQWYGYLGIGWVNNAYNKQFSLLLPVNSAFRISLKLLGDTGLYSPFPKSQLDKNGQF